ncbi:MAG: hypothetical protein NW220_16560 [Leptolyngbyaceae cyanobacterium bins.349]|nr:hypothetical protein [Leptolyngbyaceae cyanobacterium bins.349]
MTFTSAPIVAGIGTLKHQTFVIDHRLGRLIWTFGVTWLGYFLGQLLPDVDKYLLPIILIIVIGLVALSIFHLYSKRKSFNR